MPSLDNSSPANRDSTWLGIVKVALAQIVVLLALVGAFIFYVNWSSAAALADFRATSKLSLSEPQRQAQWSIPLSTAKGPKACFLRA